MKYLKSSAERDQICTTSNFQKGSGNTFTLLIIFIVKSLQKEHNSTNLLLWPPICRNKPAITPKWFNSLDTNSSLYSIQVSLLWFWTQCLLYWATCVVWHEKQSIVEQNHFLLLHTMYSNKLHSGYIFQGEAWSLAHGPPWVDGLVNSSPQCR